MENFHRYTNAATNGFTTSTVTFNWKGNVPTFVGLRSALSRPGAVG
jgi:hypothetical protein